MNANKKEFPQETEGGGSIHFCPSCTREHRLQKDGVNYHCHNCGRHFIIVVVNE